MIARISDELTQKSIIKIYHEEASLWAKIFLIAFYYYSQFITHKVFDKESFEENTETKNILSEIEKNYRKIVWNFPRIFNF